MVKFDILTGVDARALLLEERGLLEFFLNGLTGAAILSWQSPNICAQATNTSSFDQFLEFELGVYFLVMTNVDGWYFSSAALDVLLPHNS